MSETLLDALERAARSARGIRFLVAKDLVRVSYSELARDAARIGAALMARYEVGRPLLLALPNGRDAVACFFGALTAGLVPAFLPLPRPFGDAATYAAGLARVSRQADGAALVTTPAVAALLAEEPLAAPLEVLLPAALDAAPRDARPHDDAVLQFTSGSLGDPKGAALTHAAVLANVAGIAERLELGPDDLGCSWIPLAHDMGLIGTLLFQLAHATEQVLLPTERFAGDPGQWLRIASALGVTLVSGPPFGFDLAARRLVREAERGQPLPDLARIRGAVTGAEPIDARLLRAVAATLAPAGLAADVWRPSYGLAENACCVSLATRLATVVDARGLELTRCGRPLSGVEVRVVDDRGAPLGDGAVGHLEARGSSLMRGYWRAPEHSAEVLSDGWLRTGDQGFLVDGEVVVAGRDKDVIIVRGRHFFPEEIEAIALEVPGVRARGALAFGEPDPSGGPEPVTVLVEPSGDADLASVCRAVAERIADRLDLIVAGVVPLGSGQIPRTPSGKLRRGEARARFGRRARP